jgi:hypothetical protein
MTFISSMRLVSGTGGRYLSRPGTVWVLRDFKQIWSAIPQNSVQDAKCPRFIEVIKI